MFCAYIQGSSHADTINRREGRFTHEQEQEDDINLPSLSGLELLHELKRNKIIDTIPVIILSTSDLYQAEERVSLAVQYIVKPHTFDDLKTILKQILI